jgi:hypothetical protein
MQKLVEYIVVFHGLFNYLTGIGDLNSHQLDFSSRYNSLAIC